MDNQLYDIQYYCTLKPPKSRTTASSLTTCAMEAYRQQYWGCMTHSLFKFYSSDWGFPTSILDLETVWRSLSQFFSKNTTFAFMTLS